MQMSFADDFPLDKKCSGYESTDSGQRSDADLCLFCYSNIAIVL